MKQTQITTDKSFISLNYDTEDNTLTGDTQFYITLEDLGDEPSDNLEVEIVASEDLNVFPSSFTAEIGVPQLVAVRLADDLVLENGNFNFSLKINNEYAEEKTVVTTIYASENKLVNDDEYKLKYFIQREKYICRIFELVAFDAVLIPIEINGRCDLSYQEKKELTEPIIAASLSMKLEASILRDLAELNSSDEKTFRVEIEKEGNIIFNGFIIPDDSWRNFVSEKWIVDVKAICGLASLNNLAFAQENSTGDNLVNFFGRMTAIDIINNCLQKTGLNLPIFVNCQIIYTDILNWNNILSSIYLSVERYFQNADEPMDCDAVLRSVMQIFGASIEQKNNAWFIYRSKDLTNRSPLNGNIQNLLFSKFNGSLFQQNVIFQFGNFKIGSNINDAEIFHCNENQMLRDVNAISAYQISYQFGDSKNVLANGGLILEGATGINIPGWNVYTNPDGLVDRGVRIGYGYGLRSAVRPLNPLPVMLDLNQSISVTSGVRIVFKIKYRNDGQNSLYLNFAFGVYSNGAPIWYDLSNGTWGATYKVNRVDNYHQVVSGGNATNYGNGDAIFEMEATIPADGIIIIQVLRNGHGSGGLFGVHSVELFPSSQGNIKSKDYIARKNNAKSTAVKNSITVFNGDSESDLFVGTIFKSDSDTPTTKWTRYYLDSGLNVQPLYDNKELLEIIAGEGLSMSPRPMIEFEGDFKGYIPHLDYFYINSFQKNYLDIQMVDKQFQFLKWSYSLDDNITKMFAREIEESNLSENVYNVKIYENFGNEQKITVVS